MIAVAPKIAVNLTSTKGEAANSPANSTAPGKSFSTVLQETAQNCQSHTEDSGSSEANAAGSRQLTALHSKTGHVSGGSHDHSGTSDQGNDVKPDSPGTASGSHPASLAVPASQPQVVNPATTAMPVGTATTIQTQDSSGDPNAAADQPAETASASTALGLAANIPWSQSGVVTIPTARPQPTDITGKPIPAGTVSANQTQDSKGPTSGSLDHLVDMATVSPTLTSAAMPSPWSQLAAITVSASTDTTSTESFVETVGSIQMQGSTDDPNSAANQPTDAVGSSPLLVSTLNSAVGNLSGNAVIGNTVVAPEAQAPDSKTSINGLEVSGPSAQPFSADAVQSPGGNSVAEPIPPSVQEQIRAAIAAGAETSHLAAAPSSSTKAQTTALPLHSAQEPATNLKPAKSVAPGENVAWVASHGSTVGSTVLDTISKAVAQTANSAFQGLPLTAPTNGASKAQSPVDGAHSSSDLGATESSDSIATQVAATTASKNAVGGSENAQPSTSQNSAPFFVATQVSNQGAANDASAAARVSDLQASNASSTPMQILSGANGSNESQATTLKADGHLSTGLPATSSAIANAENHAEALAASSGSLLHSAKLVERIGQTELRVGVQTEQFGNVDIRTSMARNQFSAQISVERPELGKVLAAELPNLQNRLSEQRIPGANITLENQSSGGSAGFGRESRQSQTTHQIVIPDNTEVESPPVPVVYAEATTSTARLDVHM